METLYRKVAVSERLPKDYGFYFIISVNGVQKNYWFNGVMFFVDENVSVKYWLEPIKSDPLIENLEAEKKELLDFIKELKDRFEHYNDKVSMFQIESLIQKLKQ